tara:strand:- start:3492 stop:7502 length:4011 start_codon:yes stop_codon:yes gene_type:complete
MRNLLSTYKNLILERQGTQPGPYRNPGEEKASPERRGEFDHHNELKKKKRHGEFHQLRHGIVYRVALPNGREGGWVGRRKDGQKNYFGSGPDQFIHAKKWVDKDTELISRKHNITKGYDSTQYKPKKGLHWDDDGQHHDIPHYKHKETDKVDDNRPALTSSEKIKKVKDGEQKKYTTKKSVDKKEQSSHQNAAAAALDSIEKKEKQETHHINHETGEKTSVSDPNETYVKDTTLATKLSNEKLLNNSQNLYPNSQNPKEFHENYFNPKKSSVKQFLSDGVKDNNPEEIFRWDSDLRKTLENSPFPEHYVDVLERMMNTHINSDATQPPITSILPEGVRGGAGKIPAQAGEIMTMVACSMDDNNFKMFKDAMNDHIEKLGDQWGNRCIDQSWIHAMQENRIAIHTYLESKGHKIPPEQCCWDTPQEAHALGLQDYAKNKGFSTDFFMALHATKELRELSQESLKKNSVVNFLNSGTGQFDIMKLSQDEKQTLANLSGKQSNLWTKHGFKESVNINKIKEHSENPKNKHYEKAKAFMEEYNEHESQKPSSLSKKVTVGPNGEQVDFSEIHAGTFSDRLRKLHIDFMGKGDNLNKAKNFWKKSIEKHTNEFETLSAKDAKNMMKAGSPWSQEKKDIYSMWSFYKGDINSLHNDLEKGSSDKGNRRPTNKIMYTSSKYLSGFDEHLKSLEELNNNYTKNAHNAIAHDKELQQGMLREIKDNFPIQAVMEGEENMAIGHVHFNQDTARKLFGVDSWNDVKENLTVKVDSSGSPYLAHVAEITGKITPLSTIVIRPDGIHYGGQMKFEQKLHPELAKGMDNVMAESYGVTDLNTARKLLETEDDAGMKKILKSKKFSHYSDEAIDKIMSTIRNKSSLYEQQFATLDSTVLSLLESNEKEKRRIAWEGGTVDRVFPDFDNPEEFQDILQIPLSPSMLKRVFPTRRDKVFHVVDPHHVKDLIDLQGTKKSISTFYNMDSHPMQQGINTRGGIVAELEANILMANSEDVMSRPDKSGRRYVAMSYFENNPFWQEHIKEFKTDMLWKCKDILKKQISVSPKLRGTKESDIDDMKYNKFWFLWSDVGRNSDGKTKNKMIKDYFDSIESVMNKHSKKLESRLFDYSDDKKTTGSWDEIIANEIKIDKMHITKETLDAIDSYEPGLSKEILNALKQNGIDHEMHDNSTHLSLWATEKSKATRPKIVKHDIDIKEKDPETSNAYVGSTYHDKPISDNPNHRMQHDILQIHQDEGAIRGFIQLRRGFVWETRSGTWGGIRRHDDHGHRSSDPKKHRKHGGSYFKDKAHAIEYVNGSNHDKLKLSPHPKDHNDMDTRPWSSSSQKMTQDSEF